jgi:ABC-type antimicrobial peptide transport system permease subunit
MGSREMTVVARLEPGAEPSIAAVKGEVEALDPDVPLRDVEMLAETVDRQMGPARFYMTLLAVFAGVAVTLAAVGLYGVIAYLVSGRTREIGIRMALGARGGDVVRMVVVQGIRPAIAGVVLGVLGAYLGARGLRTLLYGVTPSDPLAVLGAIALLLGVAILAILLPARRASRVAPVEALRSE